MTDCTMTPIHAVAAGDALGTIRAPSLGAALRSHPAWRRYVAATIRLRRCTNLTPRSIAGARFARVLDLERGIMRATGCGFGTVLAAGQADAEAVAWRYRRWLP